MKAVGIVVEYNPFHNGHIYHLQQAKKVSKADVVVAVMSGNFTQRGEPTILDKWQRTKTALDNGVDLVIELPLAFAVEPADRFAAGALRLLADLQVNEVVFGAEHPQWDFTSLVNVEKDFKTAEFKKFNQTFATQFNQQLKSRMGVSLTDPNDILAFSYYKAKINYNLNTQLHPIQRINNQYHDQEVTSNIASASAVRRATSNHEWTLVKQAVPVETYRQLRGLTVFPSLSDLYPLLRNELVQMPVSHLADIYQMSEGLEHRLKRVGEQQLSFENFIQNAKTKRYTYAHMMRVCLYTILQATTHQVELAVKNPYLHVLGFTPAGQQYLHEVKKKLELPLITKVDENLHHRMLDLDYRAGKLYQNFTSAEQDLKRAPIMTVSSKSR